METLKHECGIAMVRLRKPLKYYEKKYGSWMYGFNKLYLLMEKQHNRGQEGAGIAAIKLNAPPGVEYVFRQRAEGSGAIAEIYSSIQEQFARHMQRIGTDPDMAAKSIPFAGECYMGHLRYSTTGHSGLTHVHPMIRRSNWRAKSMALCGNFNLTNVEDVFEEITSKGQHPRLTSDTHIILEQLGHCLDREVERLYRIAKNQEHLEGMDITHYIEKRVDLSNVLHRAAPIWDGGFVICGMNGSGDAFVIRDKQGIRPCFYYIDEEIVVVASERPVIQTVMNLTYDKVTELKPGEALLIGQSSDCRLAQILPQENYAACSFERIYFSRGSDKDIYEERKNLGRRLAPAILETISYDLENTVFSFIPNTAEVAYYGMTEGLNDYLNQCKLRDIQALGANPSQEKLSKILAKALRTEKVALKDIKLRTFIAEGNSRNDLAAHVYDVTYGSIRRGKDQLVVIDDSIVRGTTLRQSILTILDRLGPTRIVIVSSSPQIRYPDYYGIDMRRMDEFIAFRAAVALLEERGMAQLLDEAYKQAIDLRKLYKTQRIPNVVKQIYQPFSTEEISDKMVALIKAEEIKAEVKLVFQSIEGLHEAIPHHPGDWYFTGDYPTEGGTRLVNEAFIAYMEQGRAIAPTPAPEG